MEGLAFRQHILLFLGGGGVGGGVGESWVVVLLWKSHSFLELNSNAGLGSVLYLEFRSYHSLDFERLQSSLKLFQSLSNPGKNWVRSYLVVSNS